MTAGCPPRAWARVTLAAVSAPGLSSAEDRLGPTKAARHFTPRAPVNTAAASHFASHASTASSIDPRPRHHATRAHSVESRVSSRVSQPVPSPIGGDPETIMPAAGEKPAPEPDMYASLGVSKTATNTEIRRAYRNLITKVRGYPSKRTRRPARVPSPMADRWLFPPKTHARPGAPG